MLTAVRAITITPPGRCVESVAVSEVRATHTSAQEYCRKSTIDSGSSAINLFKLTDYELKGEHTP